MKCIIALRSENSDSWLTYSDEWSITKDPSEAALLANSQTAEIIVNTVFSWAASRHQHETGGQPPPKCLAFIGRPTDSWDNFRPFVRLTIVPRKDDPNRADIKPKRQPSGLRFGHEHLF